MDKLLSILFAFFIIVTAVNADITNSEKQQQNNKQRAIPSLHDPAGGQAIKTAAAAINGFLKSSIMKMDKMTSAAAAAVQRQQQQHGLAFGQLTWIDKDGEQHIEEVHNVFKREAKAKAKAGSRRYRYKAAGVGERKQTSSSSKNNKQRYYYKKSNNKSSNISSNNNNKSAAGRVRAGSISLSRYNKYQHAAAAAARRGKKMRVAAASRRG
jgi:hypothetical protein